MRLDSTRSAEYKAYYAANKARLLAKNRAYYAKNKADILAKQRVHYHANPEKNRAKWLRYRSENLEKIRARYRKRHRTSAYRAADRKRRQDPAYRARKRAYYDAHREKIRAQMAAAYQERKVQKYFDEQVNMLCEKGCGTKTLHPTGVCKRCRTTQCRRCQKPLLMEYIGQRLHSKCTPRAPGAVAI